MKSILLFCLFAVLVACGSNKREAQVEIKPGKFRVIASQKILNNSSLWIKQDSIFITTSVISSNPKTFLYYQSYKNLNDSTYAFRMTKIPDRKAAELIERLKRESLYKLEISSPAIEYSKITPNIQAILKEKELVRAENIYQYYGGKLFFTTKGNSKCFYVFDSLHHSISKLMNPPINYGGYIDLKCFVLFDLTGDNNPRIFTISGRQVHDDEVSLDVLEILR